MKIRDGFVTNSSSSSYVIRNKTNKDLTAVDLAKELYPLYKKVEDRDIMTLKEVIKIVKEENNTGISTGRGFKSRPAQ
jgi:hypothetical protein